MTDDCTCAKCNNKRNRTAAFGAIRRAAEVARGLEAHKRGEIGAMHDHTHWDEAQAIAIRRAIRAAIGSPKA